MARLIFVPQFPQAMRYQEFWYTEFEKEFKKYFDEVIVLGKNYIDRLIQEPYHSIELGMFSSIQASIFFEQHQIGEYNSMKIYDDDFLFLADLSFPGFFSNCLYHKRPKNCFAYCHATSLNRYDYFTPVRKSKFLCEISHSKLFKQIFLGSYYHQNKLYKKINNTKVIGVPVPPFKTFKSRKKYEIISVCRPSIQKITKSIEKKIERDFSNIIRKECTTWEQYYKFLSEGKVLISTTKEETFGYSTMEALMNNTMVMAPNNFSYPELLSKDFLYKNYEDLRVKIWDCLYNNMPKLPEKLLNQSMCDNFYENLISEMKE